MRERISWLIGLCVFAIGVSVSAAPSLDTLCDVDSSGGVSFDDARLIAEFSLGLIPQLAASGDANQDGSVDVIDARVCLRKSMGLISQTQEQWPLLATLPLIQLSFLLIGLPFVLVSWRSKRIREIFALWLWCGLVLPLTGCSPLGLLVAIPAGQPTLLGLVGEDYIDLRVQSMSDGGLASLEFRSGGFTFDPTKIRVTGLEPAPGFVLLASKVDNARGKVLLAMVNPTGGVVNGNVLRVDYERGVPLGEENVQPQQTTVEYVVLLELIVIAVITALTTLGSNADSYETVDVSEIGIASDSEGRPLDTHSTSMSLTRTPSSITLSSDKTICTVSVTDAGPGKLSAPKGTVTFSSDSGGTFTSGSTCTLSTDSASSSGCSVAYAPGVTLGLHTITANYPGDDSHFMSEATVGVPVSSGARSTTTSVTCSPSHLIFSTGPLDTTCTVTVTDTDTGTTSTPTGTVTFSSDSDGTFTGGPTCTLAGSGPSSGCSVVYAPGLTFGLHTITASYAGDPDHLPSSGNFSVNVTYDP